jgi:hypothetical protein
VPSASIQIRVPIRTLESLDAQAEREGRSRSGQARFIIRAHLAKPVEHKPECDQEPEAA